MRRLELPAFWATTRRSNQLSYIHHLKNQNNILPKQPLKVKRKGAWKYGRLFGKISPNK